MKKNSDPPAPRTTTTRSVTFFSEAIRRKKCLTPNTMRPPRGDTELRCSSLGPRGSVRVVLRPPVHGPAEYGSPEYFDQEQELLELSAGLTDADKMIAEYWKDGPNSETPVGHWFLFA